MSPTSTHLLAHERINDPSPPVTAGALTLRLSRPADDRALEELAQLDCARPLRGPHLVAEVGGTLHAAISLIDGAVIAHPFHRTTAVVELLRARANTQLSDRRAVRRAPSSLLRRLAGLGRRSWEAAS